jgi:probable F420-dependent oxidoreductase
VTPFRFSVHAAHARDGEEWLALARRAEDLGYRTLYVPDHLTGQLSPIAALAAAATVTKRIRIGPYVFANDFRHPLVMAREAATLDILSGGRLELGLGAGWRQADYRQLGYRYDRPGVRIDRLVEALAIVKRLLAGETVTHHGDHYQLDEARIGALPVQRPMPIQIGAGGPRMLRLAAREADVVGLIPQFTAGGRPTVSDATEGALAQKVELVRAAAGDRFGRIELSIFVADAGLATSSRPLTSALTLGKAAATSLIGSPYVLYGTVGRLRDLLERRREALGIASYAIPGGAMEAMAPLVELLAGG